MARLLEKMRIDEVSGVPRGAGEGVKVRLLKQDGDGIPPEDNDQAKERSKSKKKAAKNAAKTAKKKMTAEEKAQDHQAEVEKSEPYVYKMAKGEKLLAPEIEAYLKREFSDTQRQHLAATGAALPGGGYPIQSVEDLHNAISAFGRASNKAETKSHIMTRARALGRSDLIPTKWRNKEVRKDFKDLAELVVKSEGGEDFATELAEMQSLNYGEGIIEAVHDACHALKHSIESIMEDDDTDDKGEAIRESFGQFVDHVVNLAPESDVMKAFQKIHIPEELEMAKIDKEDMTEIGKVVGETVAKAMTSVGQSDSKSRKAEDTKQGYVDVEENAEGKYADQKGKEDSKGGAATNLTKAYPPKPPMTESEKKPFGGKMKKVWKDRFESLCKMTPAQVEYFFHKNGNMDDDAKKKFADMKDDEKDDEMKKNSIEGKIEKAMAALPEPMRKQLEMAEANAVLLAKMEEEKELSTFAKKATDLKLPTEMAKHFVAIHKAAPEAFEAVEQTLKALVNQVNTSRLFSEFGSADTGQAAGGGASAYDQLMAKAEEYRKAHPELSTQQAFAKVYNDPSNREVVALSKSESRPRLS